jgi:hypothetical protein
MLSGLACFAVKNPHPQSNSFSALPAIFLFQRTGSCERTMHNCTLLWEVNQKPMQVAQPNIHQFAGAKGGTANRRK